MAKKKEKKSKKSKKEKSKNYTYAMGRRKTAVATIRLYKGSGDSMINERKAEDVVNNTREEKCLFSPLNVLNVRKDYFFTAKVDGGGKMGQLEAIQLALARALEREDSSNRKALKEKGLLSVDDRVKERKKPGRKKARKKQQYSKR